MNKNILVFVISLPLLLLADEDQEINSFIMGFGSCLDEEKSQEIWKSLEKENLDTFFFMGDNVYGDTESGVLTKMEDSYKQQERNLPPWLKRLNPLAIWDDHDYGLNDAGKDYPFKRESQELFLKFWKINKDDPRHQRDGIYFSEVKKFNDKDILIIGLDTRYFRSSLEGKSKNYLSTNDSKKTILGNDQWDWLTEELHRDVDLVILVSSIQILATNHGFEKWNNFPHERQRLLTLIKKSDNKVVLVSGDRHKGGIYKQNNLYELTSSSLNKPLPVFFQGFFGKETDPLLIGEMQYVANYGVVTIDEMGLLKIFLKDKNGKILQAVKIEL